jgi:Glycosyltransferase 61
MTDIILSNGASYIDYSDKPDALEFLQKIDPNYSLDKPSIHLILSFTKKTKMLKLGFYDSNPYHLLIYGIACFYFLEDNEKIIFYYPKGPKLVEELLENLPKKFIRIEKFSSDVEYIKFPSLAWSNDFIREKWACAYIRDFFKHIWENTPLEENKFIFISRNFSSNKHRRLLNEEELLPFLKVFNIKVCHLETMTFVEQIQLFRSAKLIIGPHGAGLAWILFCNPAVKIVEIIDVIPKYGHYRNICNHLGLSYTQFPEVEWDKDHQHLNINIKNFVYFLQYHLLPFLKN